MLSIRERLANRKSALNLKQEQAVLVESAFYLFPEWNGLYLFYSGRIKPESWAHGFHTRASGLASIVLEGIPLHITRAGFERWKEQRLMS